MFYFKLIALLLGVEMVSIGPVFILLHKEFKEALLYDICPPSGLPGWVWFPMTGVIGLIFLTWYVEYTTVVDLSWIITLYLTLGLGKFYMLVFRYEQFRQFLIWLSRKERLFQWGFGSFIYFLGIFFLILGMYAF